MKEFKTQMIMDNRKEIVEKIINALNDRGGFDDWWCNIDEEIQTEITDELVNILPTQIVSGSLLPTTLMRIHPELTYSEAYSLMEFAESKTIRYEECYGDGSIIYPMWKEANYR